MEKIAQLKANHLKTDTSELERLLSSKLEIINEKHQEQQLNEDDIKLQELTSKLIATKEILCTETQTLEHKNEELSKHNRHLEELEVEKSRVLQEIKQLEGKRNNLKSAKRNSQDQQVLQQGKRKLRLYKDLTRIQWDYEASKHSIKGYISNKNDYIHHFCYADQQIDRKLTDSLWHEIYLSTGKTEVENLQPNIISK